MRWRFVAWLMCGAKVYVAPATTRLEALAERTRTPAATRHARVGRRRATAGSTSTEDLPSRSFEQRPAVPFNCHGEIVPGFPIRGIEAREAPLARWQTAGRCSS